MNDEREPMTIGEFHDRCASMFAELEKMLEQFDDDTDPAGIADAIVGRYLAHYLGSSILGYLK